MGDTAENTEETNQEPRPEAIKGVMAELNHIRGRSGIETSLTFASFVEAARTNNWSTEEIVQGTSKFEHEHGGNLVINIKKAEEE